MGGNKNNGTPISLEQAKEIALTRVPGEVLEVNIEDEYGIITYEVMIRTPDNRIFEVNVFAKDGRILKVEEEQGL